MELNRLTVACMLMLSTVSHDASAACISTSGYSCDTEIPPIVIIPGGEVSPAPTSHPVLHPFSEDLELRVSFSVAVPSALDETGNWTGTMFSHTADVNRDAFISGADWLACRYATQCPIGTATAIEQSWDTLGASLSAANPNLTATTQTIIAEDASQKIAGDFVLKIDPLETPPAQITPFGIGQRVTLTRQWLVPSNGIGPVDIPFVFDANVQTVPSIVEGNAGQESDVPSYAGMFSVRLTSQRMLNGQPLPGSTDSVEIVLNDTASFSGVEVDLNNGTELLITLNIDMELIPVRHDFVSMPATDVRLIEITGDIIITSTTEPTGSSESGAGSVNPREVVILLLLASLALLIRSRIRAYPRMLGEVSPDESPT